MADPLKVALITGAGSGIGRAAAILLARSGFTLALVGRREEPLRETASLLPPGSNASLLPADIADPAQARRIVESTDAEFGRLDVLINNAGYAPSLPIEAHTADLLGEIYRINALGPANTIAAAWPIFHRQGSGRIINISTLGTIDPFPGFFGYAAAKTAVESMVRSCATEGRKHGIRAFAIAPGAIETAMLRSNFPESKLPRSSALAPEAVAEVILACASGDRDSDSGARIIVAK